MTAELAYKDMIFVSIEAFLEPHSSAMGREKTKSDTKRHAWKPASYF